ncbi:MAG: NUDIX hydrolase [Nannocystaceae bacterium]|nr:NUDIX hydrolase [bacterium]
MTTPKVVGIEVLSHAEHGGQEGFLRVERYRLRNRRDDGTLSAEYICDFLGRPKGPDAVVVVLYHRDTDGQVSVLLRAGLRPALRLGRPSDALPVPEPSTLMFTEVVAGIVERGDLGEAGIRTRAAIEAHEEAGVRIDPTSVVFLGAGTFPSPGSMPEKFWLTAAHVEHPGAAQTPPTDGSPMEEGASCWWTPLNEAIEACVRGDIEDAKTELALRRLRDTLTDP